MDGITQRAISTNGIRLNVAEAGPPTGRLVILLHGFPEFWYGWHKQIPALAAAGFRVWAPDLRGYNTSDKPPNVRDYTLYKIAGDIAGLIDAAGQRRAIVAGHDWGGAAAWLYFKGQDGWALFMLIYGVAVISSVDNFVKPILMSRAGNLSMLLVVLGVFGGAIAFGFIGLFVGPALLAVGWNVTKTWLGDKAEEPA